MLVTWEVFKGLGCPQAACTVPRPRPCFATRVNFLRQNSWGSTERAAALGTTAPPTHADYEAHVRSLTQRDLDGVAMQLWAPLRGLLASVPEARTPVAAFAACAFFQADTALRALRYLASLVQRDPAQKAAFFADFGAMLPSLAPRVQTGLVRRGVPSFSCFCGFGEGEGRRRMRGRGPSPSKGVCVCDGERRACCRERGRSRLLGRVHPPPPLTPRPHENCVPRCCRRCWPSCARRPARRRCCCP